MKTKCPFDILDREFLAETNDFWLVESLYPVSENGHYLIVPKDHIETIDGITPDEWRQIYPLIDTCRKIMKYYGYDDFNFGINHGESAGQTIRHLHFHIIGRKKGDVSDPRGGIRNVIPSKGNYLK